MNDNVSQMKNECPVCFCDDKAFYITCGGCKKISFCNECFDKEKNTNRNLSCCLCRHSYNTTPLPPQNITNINVNINTESVIDIARQQRNDRIRRTTEDTIYKFRTFTDGFINNFNFNNVRFIKMDFNTVSFDFIEGMYNRGHNVRVFLKELVKIHIKIKNNNNRYIKIYRVRNNDFCLNPFCNYGQIATNITTLISNINHEIDNHITIEAH
tara:strand:- start:112 stop:747 length:636 start_codon:yes stop_codon:yes gene_type:complete